jgi:8-oxo-dGTP pyrophosphatase MutT (NUDIX family)
MFKVSIKGVLAAPDGRVVLLQNERNEWEFPGGQIEPGESPARCLAREIQEELCLRVEVGELVDTYLFEVTPGRHVFIVILSEQSDALMLVAFLRIFRLGTGNQSLPRCKARDRPLEPTASRSAEL